MAAKRDEILDLNFLTRNDVTEVRDQIIELLKKHRESCEQVFDQIFFALTGLSISQPTLSNLKWMQFGITFNYGFFWARSKRNVEFRLETLTQTDQDGNNCLHRLFSNSVREYSEDLRADFVEWLKDIINFVAPSCFLWTDGERVVNDQNILLQRNTDGETPLTQLLRYGSQAVFRDLYETLLFECMYMEGSEERISWNPDILLAQLVECLPHSQEKLVFLINTLEVNDTLYKHLGHYFQQTDEQGNNLALMVALKGCSELLGNLFSSYPPLCIATNSQDETVLHQCLAKKEYPQEATKILKVAVEKLVEFQYLSGTFNLQAFIDRRSKEGKTALQLAVEQGIVDAVHILLHAGADICLLNKDAVQQAFSQFSPKLTAWMRAVFLVYLLTYVNCYMSMAIEAGDTEKFQTFFDRARYLQQLLPEPSAGFDYIACMAQYARRDYRHLSKRLSTARNYKNKTEMSALKARKDHIRTLQLGDSYHFDGTHLMAQCARDKRGDFLNALLQHFGLPKDDEVKKCIWFAAIENAWMPIFDQLLEVVDVNIIDAGGFTALGKACAAGHLDIIKTLILQNATAMLHPLLYSTQHGHAEVVEYFLGQQLPPDLDTRRTAICMAARIKRLDLIKCLTRDCDDWQADDGETLSYVLSQAADGKNGGCFEIVRWCFDQGASLRALKHQSIDPSIRPYIKAKRAELNKALRTAILQHDMAEVERCQALGADFTDCIDQDLNCFDIAFKVGFVAFLQQFKDQISETQLFTLMERALIENNDDLFKRLKPEHCDDNINTMLLRAVDREKWQLVGKFIEEGADVNYEDPNTGQTILHYAASSLHPDVPTLNTLIANGANRHAVDFHGDIPLMVAIRPLGEFIAYEVLLAEHIKHQDLLPEQLNRALFMMAQYGTAAQVKQLLDLGADPNFTDPDDRQRPLHVAKDTAIIVELIQHGADPHPINEEYIFPLQRQGSPLLDATVIDVICAYHGIPAVLVCPFSGTILSEANPFLLRLHGESKEVRSIAEKYALSCFGSKIVSARSWPYNYRLLDVATAIEACDNATVQLNQDLHQLDAQLQALTLQAQQLLVNQLSPIPLEASLEKNRYAYHLGLVVHICHCANKITVLEQPLQVLKQKLTMKNAVVAQCKQEQALNNQRISDQAPIFAHFSQLLTTPSDLTAEIIAPYQSTVISALESIEQLRNRNEEIAQNISRHRDEITQLVNAKKHCEANIARYKAKKVQALNFLRDLFAPSDQVISPTPPEPDRSVCDAVALEVIQDPKILRCGHSYSDETVKMLPPDNNANCVCPECRAQFKPNETLSNKPLQEAVGVYLQLHQTRCALEQQQQASATRVEQLQKFVALLSSLDQINTQDINKFFDDNRLQLMIKLFLSAATSATESNDEQQTLLARVQAAFQKEFQALPAQMQEPQPQSAIAALNNYGAFPSTTPIATTVTTTTTTAEAARASSASSPG